METWVQSEGFHQYLIIGTEETDIDSLVWKMLMRYTGTGLLPFEFRCQNGSVRISYDIRGFASLQEYFANREMDARELRALFQAVWDCYEELEDYLLPMEGFLLRPEWIYYQPGRKQFQFCYCPGGFSVFQEEFSALVEFCMRRTRHQDSEGVFFIYGLYRLLQEEGMEGGMLQRYLAESDIRTGEEGIKEAIIKKAEIKKAGMKEAEMKEAGIKEAGGMEMDEKEGEMGIRERKIINDMRELVWKHPGIPFYLYSILSASALCAVLVFGIRFLLTHRETDLKICIILAVILLFCLYSMLQSRHRTSLADVDGEDGREPSPAMLKEQQLVQEYELSDLAGSGETIILQSDNTAGNESIDQIFWVLESKVADNRDIPLRYLPGVLGRDVTDVDYVVADEGISRRHLLLFLSGEELYAEDLGSTNGTYINGQRLETGEPVQLCEGDSLSIATNRYQVQRGQNRLEKQNQTENH